MVYRAVRVPTWQPVSWHVEVVRDERYPRIDDGRGIYWLSLRVDVFLS